MCSRVWRAWRTAWSSRSCSLVASSARQVGVERHLRVDDHELAARQPHEHVRAQHALAGADRGLLDEVAVVDHPRHLHDVAQLDLAPGARGGGPLQRRDEVAGLLAQRAHPVAELADHLRELPLRLRGARAPGVRSRPPCARAAPATGPTSALDLLRRRAISPAARSSSARRASASRWASESPVRASTSREIAVSSLAHPLAAAPEHVRGQAARRRATAADQH